MFNYHLNNGWWIDSNDTETKVYSSENKVYRVRVDSNTGKEIEKYLTFPEYASVDSSPFAEELEALAALGAVSRVNTNLKLEDTVVFKNNLKVLIVLPNCLRVIIESIVADCVPGVEIIFSENENDIAECLNNFDGVFVIESFFPVTRWRELEKNFKSSSTMLQRMYYDGHFWRIGPLFTSGRPGVEDEALRLLSVSKFPNELLKIWKFNESCSRELAIEGKIKASFIISFMKGLLELVTEFNECDMLPFSYQYSYSGVGKIGINRLLTFPVKEMSFFNAT